MILGYDKTPVDDYRHVQRLVAETRVGKNVTLECLQEAEDQHDDDDRRDPDERGKREGGPKSGG